MGREDLLDALVGLQAETSIEQVCNHFGGIHKALSDIHRKRWRFLEDACSIVLRQISKFDTFGQNEEKGCAILTPKGVDLCLQFIEPLIRSTASIADAWNDKAEVARQRGVLVAAILYLFAKMSGNLGAKEVKARLVANVLRCDVEIHVILATLRFREELVECRRVLLPSYESESESESESDNDEEMEEFTADDIQWIVDQVAHAWGLTNFCYFLQTSMHDHAFSSWSYHGITNFVHALLTDSQHDLNVLSVVVSPFSWLFLVAPYAHNMIHSEDHQDRIRGLDLLRVVSDRCPRSKLTLLSEKGSGPARDEPQSFRNRATSFRARDWLSPLIQVIVNAMVSFPEVEDRSRALQVLKELVFKLVVDDRFWLLRGLIMKCPYGNVSAVLVDFAREDAVQAWSSSDTSRTSPFKTAAICLLLRDVLSQAAERNLVLQTDVLASCMSLVRFLYIRDKDNETGIRTNGVHGSIRDVLMRINRRLQVTMKEATPCHSANTGSCSIDNDLTHLMVLEAALGSTLEALN